MSPVNTCGYKVLEQGSKKTAFRLQAEWAVTLRFCLLLLFSLLYPCLLPAQISNIRIENITFPNGQQLADVRAITQDSTGLLWFYTYSPSALYTYDGKTLTKFPAKGPGYQLPESFFFYARPQEPVFYLTPPTKDSIWLFDPYRRAPSAYLTGAKHMFRIAVNSKGQKWVQTYVNEGLVIGRIVSGQQVDPIDTVQYRWYYDVVGIWQDHYYVKISDRVYVFDEDKLRHTYEFYPKGPNAASSTCVVDAENTMWAVYSPEGLRKDLTLFYLRPGMQEFEPFPGQETMTGSGEFGMIFFDGQDLWYRSDAPFRLFRKKAGSEHFEDMTAMILRRDDLYPFYNSTIKTIFRDRSAEVWIASQAGVVKVSLEEKVFSKYVIDATVDAACRNGNCAVRGIGEDGRGNIYFSYEDGLAVLDAAAGKLSALSLDISISPMLPHQLSYYQDKLYLNEYEIDLTTGAFHSLFPETFNANMARDIDGPNHRMWMAVHRAPAHFYRYDLETGSLTKASFPDSVIHHQNDRVRRLHYSPTTRSLFMGTMQRGLIELKESGEAKAVSICCNATYDLYEDDQQQLWIAGGAEGLSKLDLQNRRITAVPYRIAPDVGPLKNVFHLLPEGREDLWLIGDQGVFRLHTPGGELSRFPMFPSLSKMGFFELPAFAASDGTFYVGAIDGSVYAFRPEEVVQRARLEERFPIALTRYSRYDARLDSNFVQQDDLGQLQEIRLTHRHRSFSLEFFVPDFRNSLQNRYTYYLEGYDRNWSTPANFNQLQYENLPPGEYALRIRGGLMEEYFPSSERILRVTVLQAWYKTGWAIAAYALAVAGCVLLLYRFQLRRRLEKAEAARIKELDTLKTSFYTNITHEFRTPLTVMLGMTDQIGGYEKERLIIRRNGRSLLRLVNQLLDLSKMDAGNLKLDLVQGDIIMYLRYLTESFQSTAREKQIDLLFTAAPEELIMDYDEIKIQHILYNLLSNALKFTAEGGKVQVTVELEAEHLPLTSHSSLLISIRDTGIGIPAAELERIFDRFYQVDGAITRKGEGAGIGLALTRELVGLMGGRISVRSDVEQGTEFRVRLPVHRTAGIKTEPGEARPVTVENEVFVPEAENSPALLQGSRHDLPQLLIVEDNADVALYIRNCVSDRFLVEFASDGRQGFEKAVEMIPDILISDVMMPEMDGYALTRALKNDERTSHIPVILLTAKADQDSRLAGLSEGADAYLTKPFDKRELLLRLDKLLELRRVLQEKYSRGLPEENTSPREPGLDERFLQKIYEVIDEQMADEALSIDHFCAAVHLGYTQVYRKIKALTGYTPTLLIRARRLAQARSLLAHGHLSVSEVAFKVGFNDPNYFSRVFRQEFGVAPSEVDS